MGYDYGPSVALAQRLIERYGRVVQVQQLSGTAADPEKPWEGPGVPTVLQSQNCHACFVPATGGALGQNIVPEQLLARVEQVALVEPTTVDMSEFNQILDGTLVLGVEWVQTFRPGPTILLYVFGIKA